ncbi:trehalose-phosphatase [Altererythrobacter sp. Z27]|uniref:trehalose-phosphatase n=1 Tax=Altererythrobacter sp. Z27 TaxID=3461147 RepID=UPI004044E054
MDLQTGLPAPPPLATFLKAAPVALYLDFDGTLVEIAARPDAIAVPGALGKGLEHLAARLGGALAVVTGRSIVDLRQYLGPVALHLAGSHGGHVLAPNGDALLETRPLSDHVGEALGSFASKRGLLYEPKAHGAALHYREKPEMEAETQAFARGLANEHGLGTKSGKCVIEIVWPGTDKGGAVELLASEAPFKGRMPVFIGDDVTDEDGFIACSRMGGFGILVGERSDTQARYRLKNVGDVYEWLNL